MNTSSGLFDYQKGSLGPYTMDGASNGKGFYKNDKNSDLRNVDLYLHFSSIINNWMVNIGYWTLSLLTL